MATRIVRIPRSSDSVQVVSLADITNEDDLQEGVIYQRGDLNEGWAELQVFERTEGGRDKEAGLRVQHHVTIDTGTHRWRSSEEPAAPTVNWSAIGSTPAAEAKFYALLITVAAAICDEITLARLEAKRAVAEATR